MIFVKEKIQDSLMKQKIIDLCAYRIEKALKREGFIIKRDDKRNIKVLLKIKNETAEHR
jgi:hypothetical protein